MTVLLVKGGELVLRAESSYHLRGGGEGVYSVRDEHLLFEPFVLDSGASLWLSRVRTDFVYVDERPSVTLHAVGGSIENCGYWGKLKPNLFSLKEAVYYPKLPVPRLGASRVLQSFGWTVLLAGMGAGCESSISRFDAEQQKVFEYEVFTTKSSKLPQAELFRVVENTIPSNDGLLEFEDLSEMNSDNLFCKPVLWTDSETTGTAFLLQGALWRHRRSGHIWRPTDKKFFCPECAEAKQKRKSHAKVRMYTHVPGSPLYRLANDFWGPVRQPSLRKFSGVQVFICDAVSMVFVFPVRARDDGYENLSSLVQKLRARFSTDLVEKVVHVIRNDNDTVMRSKRWSDILNDLRITGEFTTPFTPSKNGVAERFMACLGGGIAAMLIGVDLCLWCFAAEYFGWCWNVTRRQLYMKALSYNGLSPLEACNVYKLRKITPIEQGVRDQLKRSDDPRAKFQRRFGCLVLVKVEPKEAVKKTRPKAIPGVFLGISELNNSFRIGAWIETKSGSTYFNDRIESESVRFVENVLVHDVESLKPARRKLTLSRGLLGSLVKAKRPQGSSVSGRFAPSEVDGDDLQELFWDEVNPGEATTVDTGELIVGGPPNPVSPQLEKNEVVAKKCSESPEDKRTEVFEKPVRWDSGWPTGHDSKGGESEKKVKENEGQSLSGTPAEKSRSGYDRLLNSFSSPNEQGERVGSDGTKLGFAPPRPGRGRPKGSKDKNPNGRKKRKKNNHNNNSDKEKLVEDTSVEVNFVTEARAMWLDIRDAEEEIIEVSAFITVAEALSGDERPSWIEAIDAEIAKVTAKQCWRHVDDEDVEYLKNNKAQVVPLALVLTKKRGAANTNKFKARLVCLGNQQTLTQEQELSLYAPVVSQGGNRYLLVDSAASKAYIEAFDIDTAFCNAFTKDRVYIRLPEYIREANDAGLRRLVRALYGLKSSPREWFDHLATELRSLGWQQAEAELGI